MKLQAENYRNVPSHSFLHFRIFMERQGKQWYDILTINREDYDEEL